MDIELGSWVVKAAGSDPAMLVTAINGDEMLCVSVDTAGRQWCHKSMLQKTVRRPSRTGAAAR